MLNVYKWPPHFHDKKTMFISFDDMTLLWNRSKTWVNFEKINQKKDKFSQNDTANLKKNVTHKTLEVTWAWQVKNTPNFILKIVLFWKENIFYWYLFDKFNFLRPKLIFKKWAYFSIHFETMSYCHKGDEQVYNRNIPKSSHTKNQKLLGIRINNKVSLCFFLTERKKKTTILDKISQVWTRLDRFKRVWTKLGKFEHDFNSYSK